MTDLKLCRKCKYWSPSSWCDYLGKTGKAKGKQTGNKCTAFVSRTERKRHEKQKPIPFEVVKMFDSGNADEEIAKTLGASVAGVKDVLNELGLSHADGRTIKPKKQYRVTIRNTGDVFCEGALEYCVQETGICRSTFYAMARGATYGKEYEVEVIA